METDAPSEIIKSLKALPDEDLTKVAELNDVVKKLEHLFDNKDAMGPQDRGRLVRARGIVTRKAVAVTKALGLDHPSTS